MVQALFPGTPTTPGTYNFTITATGSNGCSSAQAFTIVINCPTITLTPASPLPAGTVASAYNQLISQTGGTGTFTYTVTAGTLPPGLTLNTNGTLSGTPLTAGTYNFTITGTNTPCSGTQAYTLVIGCPTITVNPATLANGTPGVAYNQAITQTGGGAGPYNYTVTAGALPPGMTLSLAGTLGGTPTTPGTYNFTVTATGTQSNCSGTRNYTLVIACPTITVNPATLPNGTVGTSYGIQNITQTGGNGTMTYTVGTGFPPGLNLTTGGVVSGTPTAAGYLYIYYYSNQSVRMYRYTYLYSNYQLPYHYDQPCNYSKYYPGFDSKCSVLASRWHGYIYLHTHKWYIASRLVCYRWRAHRYCRSSGFLHLYYHGYPVRMVARVHVLIR